MYKELAVEKKPAGKKRFLPVVIAVVVSVVIVAAVVFIGLRHYVSYPDFIVEGDNSYRIGRVELSKDGLAFAQELIDRTEGRTESMNIGLFEAELDRDGCVTGFLLVLNQFTDDGTYAGSAHYRYAGSILNYSSPKINQPPTDLVIKENPNSRMDFLDEQIKTIPIKDQLYVNGSDHGTLRYQPSTMIDRNEPIFDGRENSEFKVLHAEEYDQGVGGISDGQTSVVFSLVADTPDGTTRQYRYVFKPVAAQYAIGDPSIYMAGDYYINNNRLTLYRNYGQDKIETDLSATEVSETLEFYGNGLYLPPTGLFISTDESLPLAFFYGGQPTLKLSRDSGKTWETIPFPGSAEMGRAVTKRAVGFVTPEFGYAALGTDWSMGGGESKRCFFTYDGGKTWTEKELPSPGSSDTLLDIAMADTKNGILALSDGINGYLPLLYITRDGGDTWTELDLPFNDLPTGVDYFGTIDKFENYHGQFLLTLGQGDNGTFKVEFSSDANSGMWYYDGVHHETTHLVG